MCSNTTSISSNSTASRRCCIGSDPASLRPPARHDHHCPSSDCLHDHDHDDDHHPHSTVSCCHGGAEDAPQDDAVEPESINSRRSSTLASDIEKGDTSSELIKFRITGMTCTGCTRKVSAILDAMEGVSGININFLAAKGEFRLTHSCLSATDIIRQVENKTGFKSALYQTDLQTLEILLSDDKANRIHDLPLDGVISIQRSKKCKERYEITFDPHRIGARSLLESIPLARLAPLRDCGTLAADKRHLSRLFTSLMIATVFTIPIVILQWSETQLPYTTRSAIVVVLATIVQIVAIAEFYIPALKSLIFSHVIEMDMLVVISITAAYIYSLIAFGLKHAGIELDQSEFFETSPLLITLVLFGRVVSSYAKYRAIATVSLRSIQMTRALVVTGSDVKEIDARLLQYGDCIKISPHSKIVTDGVIIDGIGFVDESTLSGEHAGVFKTVGHHLVAGTMNGNAVFTMQLTRLPGKNSITDIANLVESALVTKPQVQDLADRIAGYFIPIVLLLSVVVFVIWISASVLFRYEGIGSAIGNAISYAIAVLAISCPCALALAVPMVLFIAGGVAARSGIIIKKADATERSHKVTDVVFDKTGTITDADMQVEDFELMLPSLASTDISALVLGLVKDNQHPVSRAVARYERKKGVQAAPISCLQSLPGKGLKAVWQSNKVSAGNPHWLEVSSNEHVLSRTATGSTPFCIMIDEELAAIYSLRTSIRLEASEVIHQLSNRNITTHLISGDSHEAVTKIASQVGIPVSNTRASYSPNDKRTYVKHLMDSNHYVLFCGDGTNDAVAVAQAHIGVQIGDTSDMTKSVADVVLLRGLEGVIGLLDISRRTYHRIIFNFAWSLVYNTFAILLASGAFVRIRIPPAYAGLGELVSVLPIVLAALSLLRVKRTK